MSEPFVGEIQIFAGNFAPRGWSFCDGQLLAVSQNDALFSLLGTIYGGDGRTTFGLPDLRGRIPIHQGAGPGLSPRKLGEKSGGEKVTLTTTQMASHSHDVKASNVVGTENNPIGQWLAKPDTVDIGGQTTPRLYDNVATASGQLNGATITNTGNSQSHNNVMPFLCVNYIIALFGIYPSRS